MTAATALDILRAAGCNPRVIGDELTLDADPPDAITDEQIDILTTGIIAIITGRKCYGLDSDGRGCVRPDGILDSTHLLPPNVRLVCVAGSPWDRISPFARESFPELFALATVKPKTRKGAEHADQLQL